MTVNFTKLASLQPFLLKAFYQWSLEHGFTAQILIYSEGSSDAVVPDYLFDSGDMSVVLNISPGATSKLNIDSKSISFDARFKGKSHYIYIPIHLIELIFIKENINIGMSFDCHDDIENSPFIHDESDFVSNTANPKWFDFANKQDFGNTFNKLNKEDLTELFLAQNRNQAHKGNLKSRLLQVIDQEDLKFTPV